jgi:hypothetical protein
LLRDFGATPCLLPASAYRRPARGCVNGRGQFVERVS